jgi:hypothetical protein
MTDASIPVAGTTASLQTFRNNIGGVPVDAEAVSLVDGLGNEKIGQQASADSIPTVEASDSPVVTTLAAILAAIQALSLAWFVYTPTVSPGQTSFTLPETPDALSLQANINGQLLVFGEDFTVGGNTVTMTLAYSLAATDAVQFRYQEA